MHTANDIAPPWQVSQWLNAAGPLDLAELRGRVVVLHTFQMLCPACIAHGIPQAVRIHRHFAREQVAVIGLHTVFEHHDVMGPQALRVFLHEYRVPFPVGIDQAAARGPVPLTMQAYGLRGTPSVVVIDPQGRVCLSHLGPLDDLHLGAVIGSLLPQAQAMAPQSPARSSGGATGPDGCGDGTCGVDAPP